MRTLGISEMMTGITRKGEYDLARQWRTMETGGTACILGLKVRRMMKGQADN